MGIIEVVQEAETVAKVTHLCSSVPMHIIHFSVFGDDRSRRIMEARSLSSRMTLSTSGLKRRTQRMLC